MVALSLFAFDAAAAHTAQDTVDLSLPSQPLADAVTRLATVFHMQLIADTALLTNLRAHAIHGHHTLRESLDELLADTGLTYQVRGRVIVLVRATKVFRPVSVAKAAKRERTEPVVQTTEKTDLVVTGARGSPRSRLDSAIPIDAIGGADMRTSARADMNDVLQALIPSYAVNRNPNSDGNTFVRPPTLRGLPGDETLVMLNSVRLHKSSVISTGDYGSEASDIATIPVTALETVEVLRDGASAQYGSDAIAGVINLRLRGEDHGTRVAVRTGSYYAGDGQQLFLSLNAGRKLTDHGFINVTGEYSQDGNTSRGKQFCNATFCAIPYAASHPDYAALVDLTKPIQTWGQPQSRAIRAALNSGIDIGDNGKVYAFGTFAKSTSSGDFHYRYPGNGQVVEDVPVRLPDGSVFKFNQIFPAGFVPIFTGHILDYNAVLGYRHAGLGGLTYDVSGHYGRNSIHYTLTNTVNASLGPATPREFSPGGLGADEIGFNADASYALIAPITISAGAEYRREGYRIDAGESASYAAGPYAVADPYGLCANGAPTAKGSGVVGLNCANPADPVYNTLAVGANGFSGYTPAISGHFHRINQSVYGDLAFAPHAGMILDGSLRYEHYSDFGSTVTGKIAARLPLDRVLALRGSIGSGFRAPSIGQLYYSSVSVVNLDGNVTQTGLFPASNPVAQYLGAKPLKPERSVNVSAGLVAQPAPNMSFTLDGYYINIHDGIYSTSLLQVTPDTRAKMVQAGVLGAADISNIRFFQNAFNSHTYGVDLVAAYRKSWANGTRTALSASFNLNRYAVDGIVIPGLFSQAVLFNFRNQQPRWRGLVEARHDMGRLSALVRANVYGPYAYERDSAAAGYPVQFYHPEVMIDVALTANIMRHVSLNIGARNVFNNYPQTDTIGSAVNGAIYRPDMIVDWQGGFYYTQINVAF